MSLSELSKIVLTSGPMTQKELLGNLVDHVYTNLNPSIQKLKGMGEVTEDHGILQLRKDVNCTKRVFCFIDLGNIHNLLKEIEGNLDPSFVIYAFADKHFNGYGVNPPASEKTILFQSSDDNKNSADVALMWHVSWICFSNRQSCEIHVVTKDKGFFSLRQLVLSCGHQLHFHNSKDEFFRAIDFNPNS